MIVRTIHRLLLEAQQSVSNCECVALVDIESGLLFGMTDNAFGAELRELMAATAAHWFTHSSAGHLDRALTPVEQRSHLQTFVTVGARSTHIFVRSTAHPERAMVFVVHLDSELHSVVEQAKHAATLLDNVF